MKPVKESIEPINLSVYEESLLDLPYFDKSQGYGAWIKVITPVGKDKVVRQNLWDTANPSRKMGNDGFLSYGDAYGKTFLIPFYLCDSPGSFVVEVKNRRDFKTLRDMLWAPLRNERLIVHVCGKQESPSTNVPQKPSFPDLVASEDNPGATEEWSGNLALFASLRSSLSSAANFATGGLVAMAETGLQMSLKNALQKVWEGTDWESETEDEEGSPQDEEVSW